MFQVGATLARPAIFVGIVALLHACAPADLASRNALLDIPALQPGAYLPQVSVPAALAVSERDGIYPTTDIVWRGEPLGDRHAQVQALFAEAANAALADGPPVQLAITVERFHGVTEQTRALVGGTYNVAFVMALTDPATGLAIGPSRHVMANLQPVAGAADERAMIVGLLADLLARELRTAA